MGYFILIHQAKIKTENCWSKIEKFVGEKFPDCVKILLKKAGYDRLNSLSKINTARISEIEAHLDKNREWVNELIVATVNTTNKFWCSSSCPATRQQFWIFQSKFNKCVTMQAVSKV